MSLVNTVDLKKDYDQKAVGEKLHRFISEMYPICRSITGNGLRETLDLIKNHVPLTKHEVPTGTQVFDWKVPKEWNIKDAYIKNSNGEKIVDFNNSNLHVASYSIPIHKKVPLEQLRRHLHTIEEYPQWIPYRTSYYSENWGFCLSHEQFMILEEGEYEVCIDSRLENGHMSLGEYCIAGAYADEVLISSHICHPSLCNDNLSGTAIATFLAEYLSRFSLKYTYRFLFLPATIGPITWLFLNEPRISSIKHGLVLACLGDSGKTTYKKSRRGNVETDRIFQHILKHSGSESDILQFSPFGYDQRQYCSPGFNLPMGCLMRTPNGCFPEYHTSADNLNFVHPSFLGDSYSKCLSFIFILENNGTYINQNPKGEPQLGRRGLYKAMGGYSGADMAEPALLWVLNYSDGNHSLLDIAEMANLRFDSIFSAALILSKFNLLKEIVPKKDCGNPT
jgi:aminopeptidase-like protein